MMTHYETGGKNKNKRVASPENVPIHLKGESPYKIYN